MRSAIFLLFCALPLAAQTGVSGSGHSVAGTPALPVTAILTSAPYNASGFIALTTTSGTVSSGATSIPVISSAGFAAGQVVVVALAGTSGTQNFAGFISSIPDSTHIAISTTAVTGASLPPSATSGTSGTQASIVAGYLVYSLGSTTLSASASNGATSITLSNASSYKVGQGLLVTGGATSGANLVTKITAISGNTLTISPAIGNSSGVASGANVQHDDTAAWQAGLNLVSVTQNVHLIVPDGVYQINGAPSGTDNSILTLPSINYFSSGFSGYWFPEATLQISGLVPAPQEQSYGVTNSIPHWSGAIILSNATNNTAVLGAYNSGNSAQNFTNIQLIVENLTFRTYPAPTATVLDATYVESLKAYGLNFDTGDTGLTTLPVNYSFVNFAIKMPTGDNGGNHVISNVNIKGYYWGINAGEHSRLEHIRFNNVFYPLILGTPASEYGVTGVDIEFNGCPHGIGVFGGPVMVDLSLLNIEHATSPSWASAIDDVNDSGSPNLLYGQISIDAQTFNAINIVNGIHLHVVNARAPSYPIPYEQFSSLSNSHYATAPNGTMVFCYDCKNVTDDSVAFDSTAAGSGHGTLVIMENGSWRVH